jgi:hypothetical protein
MNPEVHQKVNRISSLKNAFPVSRIRDIYGICTGHLWDIYGVVFGVPRPAFIHGASSDFRAVKLMLFQEIILA